MCCRGALLGARGSGLQSNVSSPGSLAPAAQACENAATGINVQPLSEGTVQGRSRIAPPPLWCIRRSASLMVICWDT